MPLTYGFLSIEPQRLLTTDLSVFNFLSKEDPQHHNHWTPTRTAPEHVVMKKDIIAFLDNLTFDDGSQDIDSVLHLQITGHVH